jgi:lipopolysaccharide export system permease protein
MKVATRYLHNQVLNAVLYVLVGFLGLFGFFDFMEEISAVGRNGYAIWDAVLVTLLSIPSHVYELMPICVLIGTIYVLAQMAQHSEFTVLRISGLSPINALKALMGLGVVLSLFTWLMGDYLGPKAEQYAQNIKAQYGRNYVEGKTGAWLKDNQGALHYVVNVQSMLPDGKLRQIKLFEFNAKGELQRKITAESGQVEADHRWHLEQCSLRFTSGSMPRSAPIWKPFDSASRNKRTGTGPPHSPRMWWWWPCSLPIACPPLICMAT